MRLATHSTVLRVLGFCALACVSASAAWAHDVATTVQVSRTPSTADSPATGSNSGSVLGSWDITDDWSLDGSFGITRPTLSGDPSVVKAGNIYALGLGPSYSLGDHWLFMGSATLSPKSMQLSQTTINFDDKLPPAGAKDHEAQLHAESTSGGLMLMASYDTDDDDSDFQTSVTATATWNHYGTLQKIADVTVGKTVVDKTTLDKACAGATSKGCKVLTALLRAQEDSLEQGAFALSATETMYENWDAILGATYYVYSKDPNEVGVFSIASRGTAVVGPRSGAGSIEYGEGVPLSAFRFNTQFGGAWHAHDWKITLTEAIGRYVDDGGGLAATTLKAAYKFNKNWKLLSSFTFQRDTDSVGTASNGFLGSLTLRYMWF